MAVIFYVVSSLGNIDAVEHIKEALVLEWDTEIVVDEIQECVGCVFIRCCYSKVLDLAHEDDAGSVDEAGVEARFVDGQCKAYTSEDGVGMFFP